MTEARLFDVVFGRGDYRQAAHADRVAPATEKWASPAAIYDARRRTCLLLRQGNTFFAAVTDEQRERWAQAFQRAAVGELMGGKLVEIKSPAGLFYFGILPAGLPPRMCGTIPPARQGLSMEGPGRPIRAAEDLPADLLPTQTRDAVIRALGHGLKIEEHLTGPTKSYPVYYVETGVHDHWAPAGWLPLHSGGDIQWIVGVMTAVAEQDAAMQPAPDPGLESPGATTATSLQASASAHAPRQKQGPA
jgi:hypothetical protein